ncbi:MAG: D-glycero-beta-D-manno-heptose 1-phosphate adenylyltransferase [Desulfobacterales bacterium]|nr:D-glycero-beta-D-manno-heptose 1-phosphate adenylyltransferase [Desulfobacterales bacterium]
MIDTSKVLDLNELQSRIETLQKNNRKIVFTNGCFDILHAGHVRYLKAARSEGDVLVVGLNSDRSVRAIKGPGRPIVGQDHRSEVLAGLQWVDYVVIFDEPDPSRLIECLKPDVLVKGADWSETDIVGADRVKACGGKVVRVPLTAEISTSMIIRKIRKER